VLRVISLKAKALLAQLRRSLVARKDVILKWAERPGAGPIPLAKDEPRWPGLAKGRLTEAFFEPLPPDELAAWWQ
jgi:hypothetical protein